MVEIAIRFLFGAESHPFELHSTLSFKTVAQERAAADAGIILADVTRRENLEQLAGLRRKLPLVPLLCWCGDSVMEVADSFRANCDGVISRLASSAELINALRNAAGLTEPFTGRGERREINIRLTYRESQLIALLARGYKNKEIAACLGIGAGTVKVYLSTLFKKTGAKDRLELSLFGVKNALYGRAEIGIPVPLPMAARRALSRPMLTSMCLLQPLSGSL